ncbi:MAG: hypothetical protein CVV33_02090 [Methanomicrobiales archaeon HGW-Methanomicrobiales-4]|nr:MAG: hypothetical protein CVV33_02090 [Methanomicrobiales archaeon HGW-Methanomicrobiales-4]
MVHQPEDSRDAGYFKRYWNRFTHLRNPDKYDGILIIGVIIYAVFFSYLTLFLYTNFMIEFDMAIFNQAFWNTVVNGELFTNSLEGVVHSLSPPSHFGVHFSPILYGLVPFYSLFPSPKMLLIAQSFLLALGAIPIYLCGRDLLGKAPGCVLGYLYLIYPSLHGVNLHDFHEVAFLPFLLGMALWGLFTGKRNILLIFCFLSLLVKEDVSLIIGMIGLIGLYQTRKKPVSERWQFVLLIIMATCTLALFYGIIRPLFSTSSFIESGFLHQYFDLGTALSQYNGGRITYLLMIFLPLLFLPFGAPGTLAISIPSFFEILLSPVYHLYNIGYHYSTLFIPVLFMATIKTLLNIRTRDESRERKFFVPVLCLILISSLLCAGMYSPAVKMMEIKGTIDEDAMKEHQKYVDQIISVIPQSASISTQYNLLPRVSCRKQIWLDYKDSADVILIDAAFPDRAHDFNDDGEKLCTQFLLLKKENFLSVYVNKNNPELQSVLNNNLETVAQNQYLSGTI